MPSFEEIAEKLEPLGMNCELGFLLEQLGSKRSSLFRYLFTPYSGLCQSIESDFESFFWPIAPHEADNGMVVNTQTSVSFHASKLRSTCIQLSNLSEFEYQRLLRQDDAYREESQKYDYLIAKFRDRIRDPGIFHVYVDLTNSLTNEDATNLKELLVNAGKSSNSNLLIVKDCSSSSESYPSTSVKHLSNNVFLGRLNRFAPISQANEIDINSWKSLLLNFWKQKHR